MRSSQQKVVIWIDLYCLDLRQQLQSFKHLLIRTDGNATPLVLDKKKSRRTVLES
jgi:hypothetical protein